jgi:hypothetical protein
MLPGITPFKIYRSRGRAGLTKAARDFVIAASAGAPTDGARPPELLRAPLINPD